MPVTPKFTISQTESHVVITARVPYVRVSDAEIDIDGHHVSIYCKPYLLKLNFPGELVDDDSSRATYDPIKDHGTLTVHASKARPGEIFPDLDMITRLLQPKPMFPTVSRLDPAAAAASADAGASSEELPYLSAPARSDSDDEENAERTHAATALEAEAERLLAAGPPGLLSAGGARGGSRPSRPLIQVVSSHDFDDGDAAHSTHNHMEEVGSAAASTDAAVAMTPLASAASAAEAVPDTESVPAASTSASASLLGGIRYGFNRGYSGVFRDLREEVALVLQLPEPEAASAAQRIRTRVAAENAAWNPDRYAEDYAFGSEDPIFQEAVSFVPYWMRIIAERMRATGSPLPSPAAEAAEIAWSEEEAKELSELSNKEFLMDGQLVGGSSSSSAVITCDAVRQPEAFRMLVSLWSVLFAYCYDHRCTGGDSTVESAWTICTLAPPLSWLDDCFDISVAEEEEVLHAATAASASADALAGAMAKLNLTGADGSAAEASSGADLTAVATRRLTPTSAAICDNSEMLAAATSPAAPPAAQAAAADPARMLPAAIVTSLRRALSYPYLRRWDLATLCASDACSLLLCGRKAVLRALLHIRRLLGKEESLYLLNTVWLDDLCVWVQALPDTALMALSAGASREIAALQRDSGLLSSWGLSVIERAVDDGTYGQEEQQEEAEEDEQDDSEDDSDSSDADSSSESSSSEEEEGTTEEGKASSRPDA